MISEQKVTRYARVHLAYVLQRIFEICFTLSIASSAMSSNKSIHYHATLQSKTYLVSTMRVPDCLWLFGCLMHL